MPKAIAVAARLSDRPGAEMLETPEGIAQFTSMILGEGDAAVEMAKLAKAYVHETHAVVPFKEQDGWSSTPVTQEDGRWKLGAPRATTAGRATACLFALPRRSLGSRERRREGRHRMAAIQTADAPAGAPEQSFVYDGRLGELYAIFIKNLLLTIVTFGIYRFWGKTRMRRYVWSHVGFQGERFEYTGTGGELFKGFLVVVGFLVIVGLIQTLLQLWFGPESAVAVLSQLLFVLAIVYLAFVAQYTAQRYRLTRTLWRGIRGGMTGSGWVYGGKALLLTAISGITGWLAQPWASFRLLERRLNNSYFGDAKAQVSLRASEVFGRYLAGYGLMILVGALVVGVGGALLAAAGVFEVFRVLIEAAQSGNPPDPASIDETAILIAVAGVYALLLVWFAFGGILAFAWYWAGVAREIAERLAVSELRFRSLVTSGSLIALYLGNVLILLVTLGLGLPIVIHRMLRFATSRYRVLGELDASRLTQTTLERPRTGEGLLEAFDPGLF